MAKSRYNDKVLSELSESAFFRPTPPQPQESPELAAPTAPEAEDSQQYAQVDIAETPAEMVTPGHRDTTIPPQDDATVERIRKAVRVVGREPATQRLTKEEKDKLKDIIYTYSRRGI